MAAVATPGAITDSDVQLLDGLMSLEDHVQEPRMNDARHVQMTRIEEPGARRC